MKIDALFRSDAPYRHQGLLQVAGLLCCIAGAWMSGTALDHDWSMRIHLALGVWPQFWSWITWTALGAVCMMLLAAISQDDPRRLACMLWCILIGGAMVHAIKNGIDIPRPLAYFEQAHIPFNPIGDRLYRRSMPSGHSASAWCTAAILVLSAKRFSLPLPWAMIWCGLATLQSLSRVVVGAHWLSDVLVGAGIAMLLTPLIWRSRLTQQLRPAALPGRADKVIALMMAAGIAAVMLGYTGHGPIGIGEALVCLATFVGAAHWWARPPQAALSRTAEPS